VIAGRVNRHVARAATGSAPVWVAGKAMCRVAGETAKEANRGTAVDMTLRTMYDTTDGTTSGTTRRVIPTVGVSVRRRRPNASGRKKISRETVTDE
jgi:hypothetical protein